MRIKLELHNLIFLFAVVLIILDFASIFFLPKSSIRIDAGYLAIPRWFRLSLFCPLVGGWVLIEYRDRLFKRLAEEKIVVRLRRISGIIYYLLIVFAVLNFIVLALQLVGLSRTQNLQITDLFRSEVIYLAGIALFYLSVFLEQKECLTYYRTRKTETILAAHYNEQHFNFIRDDNIQEAYSCIVKACEVAPYGVELWCQRAFLCEAVMNNPDEADECIQRAGELVDSEKNPGNKEVACYENYLGYILCNRGRNLEGMEHIKRSIELDPNPDRISQYEKKLAEVFGEAEKGTD